MMNPEYLRSIVLSAVLSAAAFALPSSDSEHVAFLAQGDSWDANSLGNHRVVIDVSRSGGAVAVHIPWRRHDLDPQKKKAILVDAKTGLRIDNVFPVEVNREFGDFIFEPVTVLGEYFDYNSAPDFWLVEVSGICFGPTRK